MPVKTKTVRITLDLPLQIHTKVKTLASQNGETLRQFFIDLANAKIKNQNLQNKSSTIRKMPKGVKLGLNENQINQIIHESWLPKF
jgi:predicted metal-dependent phosphotriesterase family hydrolase